MKKFISLLAILMACILSLSVIGCDSEPNVPETEESTAEETTEPEDTEPIDDATLMEQVKSNMKSVTNMSASTTMNMDMVMTVDGQSMSVTQLAKTDVFHNNGNEYTETSLTQNMQGSTMQTLSKVTQVGNDFYVYSLQTGQSNAEGYLKIAATEKDMEQAKEQLGSSGDMDDFSIDHFHSVTKKQNDDGSVTYTCVGLRESAEEYYIDQMGAATQMMGVNVDAKIDRETVKYVFTVKDEKFVSVAIDMTVNMTMTINGQTASVLCTYDIDETFSYGTVAPITVPTDAGYATAPTYTWEQYWQLIQQSTGN